MEYNGSLVSQKKKSEKNSPIYNFFCCPQRDKVTSVRGLIESMFHLRNTTSTVNATVATKEILTNMREISIRFFPVLGETNAKAKIDPSTPFMFNNVTFAETMDHVVKPEKLAVSIGSGKTFFCQMMTTLINNTKSPQFLELLEKRNLKGIFSQDSWNTLLQYKAIYINCAELKAILKGDTSLQMVLIALAVYLFLGFVFLL